MTDRPQPPRDAPWDTPPPGYVKQWYESDSGSTWGWRIATPSESAERKCRRLGCQRHPVAALRRGRARWWLYCDWHLYGQRIVDGKVLSRRIVPVEQSVELPKNSP